MKNLFLLSSFLIVMMFLSSCVNEVTIDSHEGTEEKNECLSDCPPPNNVSDQYLRQSNFDLPLCVHKGSGRDIQVGPGKAYENISNVDWNNLIAGDTVRIFWKSTAYNERFLIKGKGTKDQPIRICGVPSDNGDLPIISGENALLRSDLDFGGYAPMQNLGVITIYDSTWKSRPANISIEGLHLKSAHPSYSFYRTNTNPDTYETGAAGIRIQEGENISIRGNIIEDCGNGIFAMSKSDNREALSENLLIEGNHIFNNGVSGRDREHNLYIQGINVTYQYNYFGRNKAGSLGGNLKDRSAGTIIRYNYFEGHQRFLDLVEVQDHENWVLESEYINSLAGGTPDPEQIAFIRDVYLNYQKAYVYGNLLKIKGSIDGRLLIHWGNDSIPENTRKGTLYFYHNTVSIESDQNTHWNMTLFDISTIEESVECFNNIVHIKSETAGESASTLNLTRSGVNGALNLGRNWISNGYINGGGTVNGLNNLLNVIDGDTPIDLITLKLTNDSTAGGNAQILPLYLDNIIFEYAAHQSNKERTNLVDIGAYAK